MTDAESKRPLTQPGLTRPELRIFLGKFFCGCGAPEAATRALYEVLEMFQRRGPDGLHVCAAYDELPKKLPDEGYLFLLLYLIDSLGVIEHGSGILGSWLTEKGDAVFEALERERVDGFEALHAMHCVHGFDVEGPEAAAHDCKKYEEEHPNG